VVITASCVAITMCLNDEEMENGLLSYKISEFRRITKLLRKNLPNILVFITFTLQGTHLIDAMNH